MDIFVKTISWLFMKYLLDRNAYVDDYMSVSQLLLYFNILQIYILKYYTTIILDVSYYFY